MGQHGVVFLQDAGAACVVGHGVEGERRRWGRGCDGVDGCDDGLHGFLAHFLIDDVEGDFGDEEGFVVASQIGAAVGAVVAFGPGIADGHAEFAFHAEPAVEPPRASVEESDGGQVAFQTVVAHGLVHAEGELDVAHVVVAVDEVESPIAFVEGGVGPPAQFGRNEEVTPLASFVIVGGPRTVAAGDTEGPVFCHAHIHTQIRCERNVIDQIVAHSHVTLRTHLAEEAKQNHQQYGFLYVLQILVHNSSIFSFQLLCLSLSPAFLVHSAQ